MEEKYMYREKSGESCGHRNGRTLDISHTCVNGKMHGEYYVILLLTV